jgi:hypothetical protein
MKIFFIFAFLSTAVSAREQLTIYSDRFGVSASSLEAFHQSMQLKKTSSKAFSDCKLQLVDNSDYLNCLALIDLQSNQEIFFRTIITQLTKLYQQPQKPETKKKIELHNYLLDVARTLLSTSKASLFNWYDIQNQKFLDISSSEKENYPFQNGDVLIAYGDKATSGMIAKSTGAGYRYSHAAVIHRDSETLDVTTLESFPHLAAVELPVSSLKQESYSHMVILRLKKQYRENSPKAISQLQTWVKNKIPFDPLFSLEGENKNYCTRMVALSIAKSMGKTLFEVFPDQSREDRPGLNHFHDQVGIFLPANIISPRSIVRSPYFEVAAEYGNTDELLKFWQVDFITGYIENKMLSGFDLRPNTLFSLLSKLLTLPFEFNFSSLLFKSQKIIQLIGPEKFAILATTEKKIFENTISKFKLLHPKANILNFPPWAIAKELELILDQNSPQFLTTKTEVIP